MDAGRKKKGRLGDILLALALLAGAGLLSYPTVSDLWNRTRSSRVVEAYQEAVDSIGDKEKAAMREAAAEYNKGLVGDLGRFTREPSGGSDYMSLLDIDGAGMMGYIEIPGIAVSVPVYHGVGADTLQTAAGHVPGSSLPVGGEGTHCVVSAHRGLPSAKLFTDLDEVSEGDLFALHVLGETLTYEVDQIRTVLPEELDALSIEEGEDYCTLVTCTPYSVNTHRLLVRGKRTEARDIGEAPADAGIIRPWKEALCIAVPVLIALFIWAMAHPKKKKGDILDDL